MDNEFFVISAFVVACLVCVVSLALSFWWLPKKMESAYQNALRTLATAVETKDSRTLGHAERVAEMVSAICCELQLDAETIKYARYGALLRDIGKAAVPHRILNKQEPLTEGELRVVHNHAEQGAQIVSQIPFLAPLKEIMLHHHERWDGSGYPSGLKSEEIPLSSRIIGVVDDYEAMISERPYHLPMSETTARAVIKNGAWTKYDPLVVQAFLKVADDLQLNEPQEAASETSAQSLAPA